MIDIDMFIKYLKVSWIKRIVNSEEKGINVLNKRYLQTLQPFGGQELSLYVKFVGQRARICLALQPYVGSSLQAACQCLQQLCLYQAFWDGDWAGMAESCKSCNDSGKGTLNLWGYSG